MRVWYPLGRLRGTRAALYVHVSVPIAAVVIGFSALGSPVFATATFLSLIATILLHEIGHALVAHRLGCATGAIRFSLIHGRCEHDVPDNRWDEALIAWGGVAAQAIVAIPLCVFDAFWHGSLGVFAPVVLILGYWSLIVAVFNLIPARGRDGLKAWRIIALLRNRYSARKVVKSALKKTGPSKH